VTDRSSQSAAGAAANAKQIEGELDSLDARLHDPPIRFPEFWAHVKEVNVLFRELRPIEKDRRAELWNRLGTICHKAKERKDEQRRAYEGRKVVSANKRSLVEMKIHDALGWAKNGRTADDLRKARELLNESLEWMKNGWSGFNIPTQLFAFDDGKMLKPDSDACWEKWREADEALRARREELASYNFEHFGSEAENAIGTAEYDPSRAKERVKEIQQAIRGKIMTSEQFAEIRRLLDKAWDRATHKQQEHHENWRDRQLDKIRRKKELIDGAEDSIEKIRDQIEHCRGLEAEARTGDYAERVRGWIEEKYGWIESKRDFIQELEDQIREIEEKLRRS
jgi:hypothetical protein